MRKPILTCMLVSTLILATLGNAAPRKRPQAHASLSGTETFCLHLGNIGHSTAIFRDKGYTYLEAREQLRHLIATQSTRGDHVIETFATMAMTNMRVIYDFPTLTPAQIRQMTELSCLSSFAQDRAPY